MTLIEDRFNRISYDYSQRLTTLRSRHRFLESLKRHIRGRESFNSLLKDSGFFNQLEQFMLLDAAYVRDVRNNYQWILQDLINDIRVYGETIEKMKRGEQFHVGEKLLSWEDALAYFNFLLDIRDFVKHVWETLGNIQHRVNLERKLIHQRTPEAFNEFLAAWQLEIKEEETTLYYFDRVVTRNLQIFSWSREAIANKVKAFFTQATQFKKETEAALRNSAPNQRTGILANLGLNGFDKATNSAFSARGKGIAATGIGAALLVGGGVLSPILGAGLAAWGMKRVIDTIKPSFHSEFAAERKLIDEIRNGMREKTPLRGFLGKIFYAEGGTKGIVKSKETFRFFSKNHVGNAQKIAGVPPHTR